MEQGTVAVPWQNVSVCRAFPALFAPSKCGKRVALFAAPGGGLPRRGGSVIRVADRHKGAAGAEATVRSFQNRSGLAPATGCDQK